MKDHKIMMWRVLSLVVALFAALSLTFAPVFAPDFSVAPVFAEDDDDDDDDDDDGNNRRGCRGLPSHAELTEALCIAVTGTEDCSSDPAHGGFSHHMWATIVNRDGIFRKAYHS